MQAVVRLTNEQVQDLMFLRRVCRLRQQQLAAQREELTAKLEDHSINPFSNTSRRSDLASQLAENLAEHHQVFYRSLWGAYNGVNSLLFLRKMIVYKCAHWQITKAVLITAKQSVGLSNTCNIFAAAALMHVTLSCASKSLVDESHSLFTPSKGITTAVDTHFSMP